jgi:anti-sigma regulatory factor (Ser/Thr protein kinase)
MTDPGRCAAAGSAALARSSCADVLPVMCWRRAFPGLPEQGTQARGLVRVLYGGHPLLDDIVLVASELFANAVRHSRSALPGGLVLMELRRWRRGVAVAVIDQGGPSEPVSRPVGETAEALCDGGRGLATVEAYASWWKWRGDASGRTVTAFFGE